MSERDLEPLRLAAEEVGLTTTEPVFYEVVVPTHKLSFWTFRIVPCSLDGQRLAVWEKMFAFRWYGKIRSNMYARRLAREAATGPRRYWIGVK